MGTAGGLVIDTHARVLNKEGKVIPGLYACGNCSTALLPTYPGPGSTLGPAMTFGYLAAKDIILKTLGFTYLNPHVYSDTVFILGNLSKNFALQEKFYFAFGASFASIIFFYSLGYMSSIFASFIKKKNTWKYINSFIVSFMSILVIYIIYDTYVRVFS